MAQARSVRTAAEMLQAVTDQIDHIEILEEIKDLPSITLHKGQSLSGTGKTASLIFKRAQPGVMLAQNCSLRNVTVRTDLTQIAVGLVDDGTGLGRITVQDVVTTGRFHLEAQAAMTGDLRLENIHVQAADARMAARRPAGFGVEVLLGGLCVYNSARDPQSLWTLSGHNLSYGSADQPIQGSGIFIFGGDYIAVGADPMTAPGPDMKGGQIQLNALTTKEVFTDGGIPAGIGTLITGGVFVGSGVVAQSVTTQSAVTTYGPNDMVLDNWGHVQQWTAAAPITSHGPSGIGFVNFGDLDDLRIEAEIVTHGLGARGFNLYDGSLGRASFRAITTHGDGAIGIQISKPFFELHVAGDVTTHGGTGDSLVRGKVVRLKAHALSLKDGAKGQSIIIQGQARTDDPDIAPLDLGTAPLEIGEITVNGQAVPAPDRRA